MFKKYLYLYCKWSLCPVTKPGEFRPVKEKVYATKRDRSGRKKGSLIEKVKKKKERGLNY